MFSAKDYVNSIAQTPKQMWNGIVQATMDSMWENTTQLKTIKEQKALPFSEEYEQCEAWVDVISEDLINTSKVYSDFVSLKFRDCDRKQNYKGQYYKLNLDEEHEEFYICYDRINKLQQTSTSKVVRCNNVLTWADEYGNIITMPCYLGTDISSTNNLVSKKTTIPNSRMIVFVQANDYTMSIRRNQRFMFQHSTCFKVEEVNNYMQEQGTDGQVTSVKMYIEYDTILPTDNTELNICDYYNSNYSITIDQEDIAQTKGFVGKLEAFVKDDNNEIVDIPIKWLSSDEEKVSIDQLGNYTLLGENGDEVEITACMKDNESIRSSIIVRIVEDYLPEKKIVVSPTDIKYLKQGKSQEFKCGIYIEGNLQLDLFEYECSGANENSYSIERTSDGFKVTNKKISSVPLTIRLFSQDCEDVIVKLELKGVV